MESYRTIMDWRSVFDSYEDSIEEFLDTFKNDPKVGILTISCYIKYRGSYSKKAEKVTFTQKELMSSFLPETLGKTLNFDYQTCWLEDASSEYRNKKILKTPICGCLRLLKKEFTVELIFMDQKSYSQSKALLESLLINLDFESKYIIKDERLGKGASANVYKIYDPATEKYYAGKFISKEYLKKTSKRVISVINEMDVLRMLDHPNIVN